MRGLEIKEDVNDHAIPYQVESESINIGEYDISRGVEHKFWLRNPNSDLIVDISDLSTVNPNSRFNTPVLEIQPLQEVQVSIKIPPITISEDVAVSEIEMPPGNDRLKGELTWKKF